MLILTLVYHKWIFVAAIPRVLEIFLEGSDFLSNKIPQIICHIVLLLLALSFYHGLILPSHV